MEETKVKTYIIKPVVKAKFSGQSSYSGTHYHIEGAQYGKSGYKTGLTREQEAELEKKLNKPVGYLSKDNTEFWSGVLNLPLPNDKPYYFTVDTVMDEIRWGVLLQRNDIAKNELEIAKNPQALFYIEDEEAKAQIEDVVINYKMEASEKFIELNGEDRKGILKLYGKRGVNELSDLVIKTTLFKEVEKDPEKFIKIISNPDIKLRIDIENMLEAGTLVKKGNYYQFEDEVIGNSIDAVLAFFKDYKNQSVKMAAKVATEKKKKD